MKYIQTNATRICYDYMSLPRTHEIHVPEEDDRWQAKSERLTPARLSFLPSTSTPIISGILRTSLVANPQPRNFPITCLPSALRIPAGLYHPGCFVMTRDGIV